MTSRVSTFGINQQMLAAALKTQARMADMQLQEASGLVSTDYGGLGTDARQLVSLDIEKARADRYQAAADTASARNELVYSALGDMADILTSFRSQLTALMSTDVTDTAKSALVTSAGGWLEEFSARLNSTYNGQYLFGGPDTTDAPVDTSAISFDLDTENTGYYQGGDSLYAAQIGEGEVLSYGINADSSAFEKALRALGSVASADSDLSDIDISDVLDLVISAVDAIGGLQGATSVAASRLERASANQAELSASFDSQISDLNGVDVTAVTASLTAYETQLEASYAALAKIQSLSILDYLR